MQTRYYDPEVGRFISQDSLEYADPETVNGLNLYAYCGNNPVMGYDPTGTWDWGKFWKVLGVIASTAIFVVAVVASAGAVGALAGVGAAALGLSTATVSFISTAATIGTYIVAGGIALFGISDAVEIGTGGYNPIRDDFMGGNQTAYNAIKYTFDVLGSLAILAGSVAPKVLQKIATRGIPKFSGGELVGYSLDFFDSNGNWSYRIDATTHGNPYWHHNPHYHVGTRGGYGEAVYYFWQQIKRWFF